MRRRRGFTFVELMIVVTIIGILASIAIPKFRTVKRRAVAAQIVGDFDVVRLAATNFFADSGYYPPETMVGMTPRNLGKYLPNAFSFRKTAWTLDYESWQTKTGSAGGSNASKTSTVIGISFITRDPALGATAMTLLGNAPAFTAGSKYTIVFAGL